MSDVPWVVIGSGVDGMHCRRCGLVQPISVPCDVETLIAFSNAFYSEHSRCLPAADTEKEQADGS